MFVRHAVSILVVVGWFVLASFGYTTTTIENPDAKNGSNANAVANNTLDIQYLVNKTSELSESAKQKNQTDDAANPIKSEAKTNSSASKETTTQTAASITSKMTTVSPTTQSSTAQLNHTTNPTTKAPTTQETLAITETTKQDSDDKDNMVDYKDREEVDDKDQQEIDSDNSQTDKQNHQEKLPPDQAQQAHGSNDVKPENNNQRPEEYKQPNQNSNINPKIPFDDVDEESSTSFLTYFLITSTACVLFYVAYHNRSKVMGLLIEGRPSHRRYHRV